MQSAPGLHVFSLHTPDDAGTDQTTKQYQMRKSHRKTRSGCTYCKSKRVKCDEKRPSCRRCQRRMLDCCYDAAPSSSTSESGGASPQELATPPQDEVDEEFGAVRPGLVDFDSDALALPVTVATKTTTEFRLLAHYDTISSSALLVGPEPEKYHTRVLNLARDHSYLFHALLAISSLHLVSSGVTSFKKSHMDHLSSTLKHFQSAISSPIAARDSDALVLTSMMLNLLFFNSEPKNDSLQPADSWVFSTDPQRLEWLSVQQGMGAILAQTRPHHCDSGLLSHFTVRPSIVWLPGSRHLPRALFDICNVTDPRGPRGVHPNPYHDPVHALALLMPLEPGLNSLIKYVHFSARVYPPFIKLVERHEPRALLVLSYWFALMASVGDLWWCKHKSDRDCFAICMYLDMVAEQDIKDLLEFPAAACGYPLSEQKGFEQESLGDLDGSVYASCFGLEGT